jgi:pilus assembly protein Flp/PilA
MSEELEVRNEEEQGASLVEYALLVALITVIAIAGITILGKKVSKSFSSTAHAMPQ